MICKVEQKVPGKPAAITTHSLIERLGRNAVELRQISVQHYPLPTHDENAADDFCQWIGDVLSHAAIVKRARPEP
jgi:hypothetical protein